jgi:type II secretory ATPase GspE/PulE/Tfp pilus assembly ATPase PilB-like protein
MRLLDAHSALKLKTSYAVREGPAAREIVRCAAQEEADLIVMGTHGRSGLAHVALGSIAEKVLRTAPCPVLVVRAENNGSPAPADPQPPLELRLEESLPADPGPALDLLQRAASVRATDVHIDPWTDGEYLIRFRIDGRLARYCSLGGDIAGHLIQRFKMLASLDVADPFRPKEGRLTLPAPLSDLEVRITTSPVAGGEAMALRLFSRGDLFRQLTGLGLTEPALANVDCMLRQGEGIVLVTGPTGSGKTTTVYSMLAELSGGSRNIVSIEDPVEYHVPFVRQMVVDERHGVTMTSGLKTLLRMDPDVLFVGEIRDLEAAEISMRAAGSGRYVFSTLHTRDVAATVTACRDLHIDNRSLAGNLTGIINQRLVRRLCQACREQYHPDDGELQLFATHSLTPPRVLYRPHGCDRCQGRGYLGRIGVFEVGLISDSVRDAIARGITEAELRGLLRSSGAASLTADALGKAGEGITSVGEALEMSAV